MRVRAKYRIKYDGVWYRPETEFEISMTDADRLSGMVDIIDIPLRSNDSETTSRIIEYEAPAARGRGRRKSE